MVLETSLEFFIFSKTKNHIDWKKLTDVYFSFSANEWIIHENKNSGKTVWNWSRVHFFFSLKTTEAFVDDVKKMKHCDGMQFLPEQWKSPQLISCLTYVCFFCFAAQVDCCFLIPAAGEIKVSRALVFVMQCSAESTYQHVWLSKFVFFLCC